MLSKCGYKGEQRLTPDILDKIERHIERQQKKELR